MSFSDYEAEVNYQNERFRQSEILVEIRDELKKISAALSNPRVYGIWNPNLQGWLGKMGTSEMHVSEYPQVLLATIQMNRDEKYRYKVREIGPDGLPVPTENEA